ncbi:MAG: type III-B CRISPR-associated protein Cas10/Cmr2 [Candidatus Competibacteraceae bacterium]
MTAHLLTVAIGPVQDFISAARRSRDLWFGSYMLSEISKATACAIRNARGQLIFPSPEALDKSVDGQPLNVANIILAELPEGIEPAEISEKAKVAANECWYEFAGHAYEAACPLIDFERWNEQLDDVLEFYAAWMPLDPANYQETRKQLMRLLAGRKACRDFQPAKGHQGIFKSSLDGARESVLIAPKRRRQVLESNSELAQRCRFARGEELDVIGVTKRAATKKAFASVVRVAADPWIRGIKADAGQAARTLRQIAEYCEKAPFATGTGDYYRDIFHYDGAVLYPSRLNGLLQPPSDRQQESYSYEDLLNDKDRKKLRQIKSWVETLQKAPPKGLGYGEPEPYLAILVADGDRMGKVLSVITEAKQHCEFSRKLAEFAEKAGNIVEKCNGCLIYSGGDDVLALLPVDRCLECARQLHDEFSKLLEAWKDDKGNPPTLSVGLAIGHCMEPLEDLLDYARSAEKAAKRLTDKNGLAVHLYPRSGVSIQVQNQWTEKPDSLDRRLQDWALMHLREEISDKAAYDLRQLARDYAGWVNSTQTNSAIEKDIIRLLKRKRAGNQPLDLEALKRDLNQCTQCTGTDPDRLHRDYHPGVMRLANEWLIARRLAKSMRQAQGLKRVDTSREATG